MTESFRQAQGRRVVSRATARELGTAAHLLVAADCRRVAAVIIGRAKKAQLIDWAELSGFGPDAIMVGDESAVRAPADERERAAAAGKLEMLGRRVLTEAGNEIGYIDDVLFDAASGALDALVVGDRHVPGDELLGVGSYAAVIAAGQELD